jgi:hypothetical protein
MHGVELTRNKINIELDLRLISLAQNTAPKSIKEEFELPYSLSPNALTDLSNVVAQMTENLASGIKCSKGEISIIDMQESEYILNKGSFSGLKEGDLLRTKHFSQEDTAQSFMRITKTNDYTSIAKPRSEGADFNVGDKLTSWMN